MEQDGGGICRYFTACESAMVATAVHAVSPLLIMCAASCFTKPLPLAAPVGGDRSSLLMVMLLLCLFLDGTAAALPLLSHVVPGMITLTGQVGAVSGVAAWSAASALLLVLLSAEHSLDSTAAVIMWALVDTFGRMLSIADAACGGVDLAGIVWRSVGAIIVLVSAAVRLCLLVVLLVPHHVQDRQPVVGDQDFNEDVSVLDDDDHKREASVMWGKAESTPALGNALESSGWFSQLTMAWPSRMLCAARVRPLFHGDLSEAPAETHPSVALDTFFLLWARRSRESRHAPTSAVSRGNIGLRRLGWVLWSMHGMSWGMGLSLRILALALRLAAVLLVRQMVSPSALTPVTPDYRPQLAATSAGMLGQDGRGNGDEGWSRQGQVGGMVVCLVMSALLGAQGLLHFAVEEVKVRNLLWAALYRVAVSQPVQAPAPCAERFAAARCIDKMCRGVASALSVAEALVELSALALVLHVLIPLWGAVAAAAMLACTGLRVVLVLGKGPRAVRWERVRSCRGQRVAASQELLGGILALKYLGWEHAMAQRVLVLRRRERRALWSLHKLDAVGRALCRGGEMLSAALLALSLVSLPLPASSPAPSAVSPGSFLAGFALLVLMWCTSRAVPAAVWGMLQAWEALDRLDAALQPRSVTTLHLRMPPAPTATQPSLTGSSLAAGGGGGGAEAGLQHGILLQLHGVGVGWQQPAATPVSGAALPLTALGERQPRLWRVLEDVKMQVKAGDRVAVVGGAGSGKTSLLMALAGEACVLPGGSSATLAGGADSFVCRPIAISTARPWVEEELTVEVNVLGWHGMDGRLLSQILDLCGLRPHSQAANLADSPSKRILDSRCSGAGWPVELRERVGLARSVYAAALACASAAQGARCLLLLDEPLASLHPLQLRASQLERILRSSLLGNAGIVVASRDTQLVQLLNKALSSVVLLRAARALVVAPSSGDDAASAARSAPAQADSQRTMLSAAGLHNEGGGASVWSIEGSEAGEESYLLLHETQDEDGTDDQSGSPPSAHSSPQHTRVAPPRRRADAAGGPGDDALDCAGAWGQWDMANRRRHGAGGLCDCAWGSKAADELAPDARSQHSARSSALASSADRAHAGRVLLQILHGFHSLDDAPVATWAPACLLLLNGIGAAACVVAPYVLMLVFGGPGSFSPDPEGGAPSSALPSDASCPPWTPCSSNCGSQVGMAWETISEQVTAGDRSVLVRAYLGLVAVAAACGVVSTASALGSMAPQSVTPLAPLTLAPRVASSSAVEVGWKQRRWWWPVRALQDDDLVSRLLLRATAAAADALVRPALLDKINCALRAPEAEGDLDAVPSGLPLSDPVGPRQAMLSILWHAMCVSVSMSWMLLVWPPLALPVAILALWLAQLAAQLSCARMHLEAFWRVPVCAQLDRLWLGLRIGLDVRASDGAKDVEEAGMHRDLGLAAAAHMTLVGAELMFTLRLELLVLVLAACPALLAALMPLRAAPLQSIEPASMAGLARPTFQSADGAQIHVDGWVLAGLAVAHGLWFRMHVKALFEASRCIAQVLPGAPSLTMHVCLRMRPAVFAWAYGRTIDDAAGDTQGVAVRDAVAAASAAGRGRLPCALTGRPCVARCHGGHPVGARGVAARLADASRLARPRCYTPSLLFLTMALPPLVRAEARPLRDVAQPLLVQQRAPRHPIFSSCISAAIHANGAGPRTRRALRLVSGRGELSTRPTCRRPHPRLCSRVPAFAWPACWGQKHTAILLCVGPCPSPARVRCKLLVRSKVRGSEAGCGCLHVSCW